MTIPPITPLPLDLYGDKSFTLHRPRVAAAAMILFAVKSLLRLAVVAFTIVVAKMILAGQRDGLLHWVFGGVIFFDALLDLAALLLLAIANLGKLAARPWPLIVLVIAGLAVNLLSAGYGIFYFAVYDPAKPLHMSLSQVHIFYCFDLARRFSSGLYSVAWILYTTQIARLLHSAALVASTAILAGLFILMEGASFFLDLYSLAAYSGMEVRAVYPTVSVVHTVATYVAVVVALLMFFYFAILAVRLLRPRIH